MKRTLYLLLCILCIWACKPESSTVPTDPDTETPADPDTDKDTDSEDPKDPDTDDDGNPDPSNPEKPDTPDPTDPDTPDDPDETVTVEVLDPGEQPSDEKPTPSQPDAIHVLNCTEFYSNLQDYLDDCGNIDYVVSQGEGTSWPMITSDGHIRLYQGTSAKKGGSYIRIRAFNGASLQKVEVGSVGKTALAYSINGKAAKSETTEVPAGGTFSVEGDYNEVKIYCMGTSAGQRWELNSIKVTYKGGFIEEDFYAEPKEYGPLVRVTLPFTEGFETGFPTTDKPSYYKYGITAGRENLQWSTWYGSFSWQNPISGSQSAQLRIYQEDEDYDQDQFGHLKMEYFIENLTGVNFKYWISEYWVKATISYCEFGSSEWKNPQQIALSEYSQRKTTQEYSYTLNGGQPVNAKIRLELDPASGYPTSGHYDFLVDDITFSGE
jgi:hypothetical protein